MSEPRNLPSRIQDILEEQHVGLDGPQGESIEISVGYTPRILGIATTAEKIMEAVGGGWNEAIEQAAHVADVQSTDSGNAQWEMAASQIAKDIRSLRRPNAGPAREGPSDEVRKLLERWLVLSDMSEYRDGKRELRDAKVAHETRLFLEGK